MEPTAPTGTVITVRGAFEAKLPPERATVRLTVGLQGPDKPKVHHGTGAAANDVVAAVRQLHDPERGPVTWWSSDRLRTWAEKPWNQDGKQLPLVFHAEVAVQAKFRDVEALARFVDEVGARTGVSVDGVTWALTAARQEEVARDARRRAVVDATSRARDYAAAAGLTQVVPVALADVGMLGDQTRGNSAETAMYARAPGGAPGGSPLALTPEDITVRAEVDARFLAT